MSIYPRSEAPATPVDLALTEAERLALKKGFVAALEEGVPELQDRALRALAESGLAAGRVEAIRAKLYMIFPLEEELKAEVAADKLALEEAYADGAEEVVLLKEAVVCKAVDAEVFADRFIRVKNGETILTPVLPVKEVIGEEEVGEIIKP